jgi:hypothetical protein
VFCPPAGEELGWPSGLDNIDCDVNVAACGAGIRAHLVRGVYQGLVDFPLQSRQADIETGRQTVNAMRYAEDHFRPANEGLLLHTHCLILYQK